MNLYPSQEQPNPNNRYQDLNKELKTPRNTFILTVGFAFLVGMMQSYAWFKDPLVFAISFLDIAMILEVVMLAYGSWLSMRATNPGDGGEPLGTRFGIRTQKSSAEGDGKPCQFRCGYLAQEEAISSDSKGERIAAFSVIFSQLGNGLLIFSLKALVWISGEHHLRVLLLNDGIQCDRTEIFSAIGAIFSFTMFCALFYLMVRYVPVAVREFSKVWGPIFLVENRNAQHVALGLYLVNLVSFFITMLPAVMIKDAGIFS
ncbi:hypothetical protein [Vibrio alginolyticus]|uniref:hypothetical protein n=1 Tax=Vibrio alginolyticus TaxID=663 RepID=UPI001C063E49|nr:hypothetical protein [Vibrio alginolyticus]